ncbi:MAG: NTP transferase domain-containing protein [Oscillochloris sp.]|nr:NTP transferase domain-containing protein [Oscillochloris sp.]
MKAVVMAGGEGTRLRPLTINRPKPMVSLVDRPVIQHIIELLKIHGITDIIVTVQYLANAIQDYYGDGSAHGVNITYSLEEVPMGTAGSVKNAEHLLTEPFLVISGDALTDFNLSQIIEQHVATQSMATLTLARVESPLDYGVVITDEVGNVRQFLEKPSWGEVFSDTVNTGIYVLNPEVLTYIERGRNTDWSKDVFPRMLNRGDRLHGVVTSGYWTDVGTIEEYMRACGDYLTGKVNLPRVGHNIGGEIWVDGDAEIAPDAQLHGPIYLGHGAKIKSGVIVHGPAVIRDYTIIDARASIDRSIIWRNSYIGERAELRGAIVLRQSNIRSRAVLFEGVVVGDGVQIGAGAVIQHNVKIWPGKEVDEGATVNSSIIWGSQGRRVLFGRHGISGLVNIEITPEMCAMIGAAYGATLPRGSSVTINRDAHYTPRMLKRAIVSGLPSAGINVVDLQSVPIPVARYYTHAIGASGGIHVRLSPLDSRVIEIRFFDHRGLNLHSAIERKIESTYFREDFRRAYLDEIGRISYGTAIEDIYTATFIRALRPETVDGMSRGFNIVVDYANSNSGDMLSHILRRLHVDAVELNVNLDENMVFQTSAQFEAAMNRLAKITSAVGAQFGARLDSGGEKMFLVDDTGLRLNPMRALAAITALAMRASNGGTVAVPVTAPRVFERIAARYGGQIIRTKANFGALMHTASQHPNLLLLGDGTGSYIFPTFYPIADGMFAVAKLMELIALSGTRLSAVLADLPPYFLAQTRIPCRWESKGKVMRILNQQYAERQGDQVDGIKIDLGDEWVLILPDPDGPFFHLYAEGTSDEQARILIDKYAGLITGLQ